MSNNIKILYNGIDVFSGISPTPIIGISNEIIDFGSKWNQITNITLEGQLTGQFLGSFSYQFLNESVQKLHQGFENNYKTLLIQENGSGLYTGLNTVINSINIEENSWYGVLPFTIEMSVYDSGLFQDYYHITEPEETFSFEETDNGNNLNLSRTISAKGLVSNNKNAIQNAKEWVLAKTGDVSKISPSIIPKAGLVLNRPFLLQSSVETIDRFNGVYTWEGEYKKSLNLENPNNCFLNYSIDLNSGIDDGFVTAKIDGSLEGNSLSILRQEYSGLNLYNLCNTVAVNIFNSPLSSRILSQSVNETSEEKTLQFSADFNNDYSDEIINNYSVDISEDSLKCIKTVNFTTNISCRYGDIDTKWNKVYSFYKTSFFPYSLAKNEALKEYPTIVLYDTPVTESISFDEFNAQITYSAQFTDKRVSLNSDIINMSSNVTLTPSINVHVSNPSAFTLREHNIFNLMAANRTVLNISATAVAKINKNISIPELEANNELSRIKLSYLQNKNSLLEKREITRNNDIKTVTINETWSFEGGVVS